MASSCHYNSYPPFGAGNNHQEQNPHSAKRNNKVFQYDLVPKSYGGTATSKPKKQESVVPKINILPRKPDNHRLYALAVLICSCPIFGIIALIYSFKVDRAYRRGDIVSARIASEKARKLSYIGVLCGIMDFIVMAVIWLVILYGIWRIQQ